MHILNIEDSVSKHQDVQTVLREFGQVQADWATYLEDGLDRILAQQAAGTPYDLIITDWYFPITEYGSETRAGSILLERLQELGVTTPVIACSSAKIKSPALYGAVWYSPRSTWALDLKELLRKLYQ